VLDVKLEQDMTNAGCRGLQSGNLLQHGDASLLLQDHLANAASLTFRAAQPMTDVVTTRGIECSVLGHVMRITV
jgi:hypothetical protein